MNKISNYIFFFSSINKNKVYFFLNNFNIMIQSEKNHERERERKKSKPIYILRHCFNLIIILNKKS